MFVSYRPLLDGVVDVTLASKWLTEMFECIRIYRDNPDTVVKQVITGVYGID
ncbi:hypothetical protein HN807_11895 [Candidatus Bathyarchaeota archaeon]|jgi:hypothetical protein|nr:hypothetical protein [Candidatus Bathyarchaeota archaeon]MBT7347773.1 hypothetical protein [Candidatus Bathyarchaeota archaeon]